MNNLLDLSDDFMAALKKYDLVSDAVYALRPNGPLDRAIITTRCRNCKRSATFPIRRLYMEERCSCGGEFDPTPLNRWNRIVATRGLAAAAREVPAVRFKGEGEGDYRDVTKN